MAGHLTRTFLDRLGVGATDSLNSLHLRRRVSLQYWHFPDRPIPDRSRPEPAFQVETLLVASYGAVQALVSPAFGKVIDLCGYAPLAIAASLAPLAACAVLWSTRSVE